MMGHCTGCGWDGAGVESRPSHAMKFLCDACAARPHRPPRAYASDDEQTVPASHTPSGGTVGQPTAGRYDGRVLDVRAMLAAKDEPIPWRCGELAADGFLTVLAGRGGEGKSWLALALACGVARGRTAAGVPCVPGRAVIFDAENGPKLTIRRFRAAGITEGVEEFLQPVDAGGLRVTTDMPWFRTIVEEQGANLVVFDSLRVLASGSKESDGDEMEPIVTALKQLARETGAAVLLIHHRGKNEASDYRGSSVILDQTDLLFTLGRVPGDPDGRHRRKITTIKCRIEEEPAPRWVRIEADRDRGLVYVNEAEAFEEEDRPRDQHRDEVVGLRDRGLSVRAIAREVGVSKSTVQRILEDCPTVPPPGTWDSGTPVVAAVNGNGWHPHQPDENAPDWWQS